MKTPLWKVLLSGKPLRSSWVKESCWAHLCCGIWDFRASLVTHQGVSVVKQAHTEHLDVLFPDLLPNYNDPDCANPQLWVNPIIHFIYSCCQATENYKSQLTSSHYKSMLFCLSCSLILLFILINCLSCSIWQQFQSVLLFYNLKTPQPLLSELPTSLKNLRSLPSPSLSFNSK